LICIKDARLNSGCADALARLNSLMPS